MHMEKQDGVELWYLHHKDWYMLTGEECLQTEPAQKLNDTWGTAETKNSTLKRSSV